MPLRQRLPLVLAALAAGLIPAAPAVASPTGVVVDELRLRGPAGGNDEFVELRNAGAAPVSIAGYRLQGCAAASGAPSTRATVPDGVTLAPGQAYLLTNSAASGYSGSVPGDQTYATGVTDLTAANASGVRIVDAAGATVDGVGAPGSAECREGAGLTTPTTAGDQAFRRTQDTDRNEADLTGPVAGDPQNRASAGASPEPEPEPEPRADGACGDAATAIGAVQGPGAASPRDGETVTVEGTVVGDFQDAARLGGFYVQDAGDGDPATSDGLFVFDPAGPAVAPGDRVRVTGEADELFGLTQLTDVTRRVTVCGAGGQPAATAVDLPLPPAARERFEGMRVTFPDTLAVTEHFELARFGRVTLSEGGPLLTPTEVAEPGEPARAVAGANAARAISLDDASDASDPRPVPLVTREDSLRRGETTTGLTGVLTYRRSAYRVDPTAEVDFAETNPRPAAPAAVGGDVQVGNFNVLNLFVTFGRREDRGADDAAGFARQERKTVAAIEGLGAEVVALQEVQDTSDEAQFGGSPDGALDRLVTALNEQAGRAKWAKVPAPQPFGNTDEIRVALIYQPAAVQRIGAPVAFPDAAFVGLARVPVAQTFAAGTDRFTVVANHFKSKGCGGATGADADQRDGQGCFNAARVAQAEAELRFVRELRATTDDPDVVVLGDLNAYTQEDPIDVLVGGGLVDLEGHEAPEERSSYVFDGQEGALDHLLATPELAGKVTGTDVWHINSDEPTAFEYGGVAELYAPDPYRSSDHDPSVLGVDAADVPACQGRPATIVGTAGADRLRGTDGDDVIVAFEGDDVVEAGNGRDVVCAGTGADRVRGGNGDDALAGGPGDDVLRGDNGDDDLRGGLGTDDLDGGLGTDREEQEG